MFPTEKHPLQLPHSATSMLAGWVKHDEASASRVLVDMITNGQRFATSYNVGTGERESIEFDDSGN